MPAFPRALADVDDAYDVICVGGGLGGLAAAASAGARGLSALIVEAADLVGGGGAYSGGLLWAPGREPDTLEAADAYLRYVQGERDGDAGKRRQVLEAAREALAAYAELGIAFEVVPGNPDVYHPQAPGSTASGRMFETAISGAALGELRPLLTPSPHYRIGLRQRELYGGELDPAAMQALFAQRAADDFLTLGLGLAGAFLRAAVIAGGADLVVGERVRALWRDEQTGAAAGIVAGDRRIAARLGVVLATGGYGWSEQAADLEGLPDFTEAGPPSIRGDHLVLAEPFGAAVVRGGGPQFSMGARLTDDDVHPGTDAPLHRQLFDAMGMPHGLVVNRAGERFGDESYYVGINAALAEWDPERRAWTNFPCWLIVDEQYRERYPLMNVPAGADYPDSVISAGSLAQLAGALEIDPAALARTVETFSERALRGEDPDFGRGAKAFVRRRYGDRTHQPNPNLGDVSRPPFHAVELRLLGTGMCTFGLATDGHARVLCRAGGEIPGLYATGNAAATSEFRGYVTGYANTRNIAMAHRAVEHLAARAGRPAAVTRT